jgi:hypothetical protein
LTSGQFFWQIAKAVNVIAIKINFLKDHLMKNRVLLAGAVASAFVLFGANAPADTITNIELKAPGTAVTLDSSPVVTAVMSQPGTFGGRSYSTWAVLAQDSTGSIDVYALSNSFGAYWPAVGDALNVTGTYGPYHQIPEITNITSFTYTSGNLVPAPTVTTIQAATNSGTGPLPLSLAGYLVEIDNVTIYTNAACTIQPTGNFLASNVGYYIKDSGGNIMEMYFWFTSYACDAKMVGSPIPTGPVNVVGLLSQSGTYPPEITPYEILVPEPATLSLFGAGALLALALRRRR